MLLCLWSQLSPARAPSSEWGSWEADAEMGFDMLAIFRNQCLWSVPCGEGIMLSCGRGVFALFSTKGRMPALNRDEWAKFVGSKVAEASGVQELGGCLFSGDPHPRWQGPIAATRSWSSSYGLLSAGCSPLEFCCPDFKPEYSPVMVS